MTANSLCKRPPPLLEAGPQPGAGARLRYQWPQFFDALHWCWGNPFRIEDKDFKGVVNHLIALRRNLLTLFPHFAEESVELFQ